MGKIRVMDEILANKIAAGEVVEKVASVVKELVENSIDAKSTAIKIELIEAGTKQIKVTDNGIGMDREDAVLAFSRHATSKIKSESDLFFINTLGFRGEALASICSVSEVELNTYDGTSATKVIIKGGKLVDVLQGEERKGTSISVSNLFYNTPARLKFLKSLNTELANTVMYIERLSLSHPDISFSLSNNGKEILKTSGSNDLLKVIHEVFGYNTSKNMIDIQGENYDYEIKGYVGNINVNKSSRSSMITFVNGRLIQNAYLNKIIKDAYHSFLAENKFPVVIINIETDPTLIDVNIHPTKQDIKFSKVDSLEELLFKLIRDVLNNSDNTFNAVKYEEIKEENTESSIENIESNNIIAPKQEEMSFNFDIKEEAKEYNKEEKSLITPVGLALGTYLVAHTTDMMYIIDIHAANERINYEIYLKRLKEKDVATTNMLFPINIELSANEYLIIKEHEELLKDLKIGFEEFGINTFRITSHPTWLKEGYEEESIKKIFDLIYAFNGKFDRIKFNESVAITLSCKMSVKANTSITELEQQTLIDRLFKCEFPYTCPHGRPTIIQYKKYDLEKLFKRVE
jgi:DNA mismatch repair protein MutL